MEHLFSVYPNHSPFLVRCEVDCGNTITRPVGFHEAWNTHYSFEPLLRMTWQNEPNSFVGKLRNLQETYVDLNKNIFLQYL